MHIAIIGASVCPFKHNLKCADNNIIKRTPISWFSALNFPFNVKLFPATKSAILLSVIPICRQLVQRLSISAMTCGVYDWALT